MELGSHGLWNRTTCILPERLTIVECAVALGSGMGSCAGENMRVVELATACTPNRYNFVISG